TPQRDEPIAAAVTALEIVAPDSASDEQEPRPRGEPVSSEPVLERVVITPEADGEEPISADATDKPAARKGWWQRRFGG
ncbi:MAG: hypothetical protein ACR2PA_25970, partial [Hyphomicrobiaceae bacterium]